jgi:uncharacterized protein YecE (DUF72 family)
VFYPPAGRRPRGRRFDELAYYAERFDTVEVNSTFYRLPDRDVVAGWAARTPAPFDFSLKLFQKFTHPRMAAAGAGFKPGEAVSEDDTIPKIVQADVDEFRVAIDPIAAAGKLGALLAQFPPSFKHTPRSREYLAWMLAAFRDYPLAVELRHRSWSDVLGHTLELLNEHEAAWVQIDEPKFRFSIRQNLLPNVKGFYYMRLHGRNAAKWWRHEASEDRYDYLYAAEELKPFAETATAVRALVRKAYLYFNNHFAAKSVANAVVLRDQLDQSVPDAFEPEMLEAYGALKPIVERQRARRVETDVPGERQVANGRLWDSEEPADADEIGKPRGGG